MNRFFSNTFKVGLLACVSVAAALSGTAQAQMVPEGGGMKQELADKGYNFRLYGKFRPKVSLVDDGDDSTTDIRDDSSRLGIQGKIPINDRLTGVLRGEWRVEIGEDRDQDGRAAGGSLGNARLAYAGLESKDAGFLGIGQQWNPYYDIAAVPVDALYNASDTPVGYNRVGAPFRTSNLIKYAHSIGAFKFSAGLQSDGDDNTDAFTVGLGFDVGKGYIGVAYWQQNADGAGRFQTGIFNETAPTAVRGTSAGRLPLTRMPAVERTLDNLGSPIRNVFVTDPGMTGSTDIVEVPMDDADFDGAGRGDVAQPVVPALSGEDHITAGTNGTGEHQTKFIGIGAGFNVTDDFYVSALYQDVSIDNDAQSCIATGSGATARRHCVNAPDSDPSALDIAAVYSFGDGMKLLAGVFNYDLDDGREADGITLGLAKNLASGLDVYVDWLREDPDAGSAKNSVNFGVRYNFDVGLL